MTRTSAPLSCPICAAPAGAEDRFGDAPLARCSSCGFVFLIGDGDVTDLYGDGYFEAYAGGDYRQQEAQRRFESRVRLEWMADLGVAAGELFEVGAAAGFFLDEARRQGYRVAGVELNDSMAAHARDRLRIDVETGTLEAAPIEARSLDAICAWHVVEHLPDAPAAVAKMASALRGGGMAFVEVPNIESALARRQRRDWPALDLPHHVGHHGPRSMRRLLEGAGLAVVALETVPFAAYGRGPLARPRRAAALALESLRARSPLSTAPHPTDHQLLRAAARRPEGA